MCVSVSFYVCFFKGFTIFPPNSEVYAVSFPCWKKNAFPADFSSTYYSTGESPCLQMSYLFIPTWPTCPWDPHNCYHSPHWLRWSKLAMIPSDLVGFCHSCSGFVWFFLYLLHAILSNIQTPCLVFPRAIWTPFLTSITLVAAWRVLTLGLI